MWTWEAVSIVAAVLASVGIVADRLLLNRQKSALQLALTYWWCRLEDASVPDLPKIVSGWFLRFVKKLAGKESLSSRGVAVATIFSLLLTSIALLIGNVPGYDWQFALDQFVLRIQNVPVALSAYVPNLLFDVITIIVTVTIVHKIHSQGPYRAFGWIVLDIVLAGALTIACVTVCIGAIDVFFLNQQPELLANFMSWWSGILFVFSPSNPSSSGAFVVDAMYSLTTFIPTAFFLGVLISCGLAKAVAHVGWRVSMHILEKATEGEPENLLVFTMLGSLVGLLGVVAKAIHHLLS